MGRNFVLTGSLDLLPGNIKPAVDKIRSEIQGALSNISLKLDIKKGQNAQISKYTASIEKLSAAMNGLATSASSAAGALGAVNAATGSVVKGTNQANKQLGQAARSFSDVAHHSHVAATSAESFGKSIGLALKRQTAFIAGTTAIFGFVGATALAIRDALAFEKEMVKVAQVTDTSLKGLSALNDTIRDLSTSLGVSSDDLTNAAQTLAQAELSARDAAIALQALAKSDLAPTFDSIEETTEGLIATMKQFGIEATQFEGVLGSMNAVAGEFAVESADLVTAIKRAGASFAQAGQGLEGGPLARFNEFLGLFTAIRATTRESAETIGTGLRTIVARIQRPATISFLQQFGVDLTDAEGRFVGAYEAFKRLSSVFSDPNLARTPKLAAVTEELGGFRQLQKVIPLLTQFSTAEAALESGLQGQSSLTEDVVTAQQSLANQIAKVREEFKKLVADIFLSDGFKLFAKGILGVTKTFLELLNTVKLVFPVLAGFGALKLFQNLPDIRKGFRGAFVQTKDAISNLADTSNSPEAKAVRQKENTGALNNNTSALNNLTTAIKLLYASRTPVIPIRGKFATGGFVGGSGKGDKIPALLEPKEFVIRRSAAEQIGAANLSYMNKTGKLPKFAKGGVVGLQNGSSGTPGFISLDSLVTSGQQLQERSLQDFYKNFASSVRQFAEKIASSLGVAASEVSNILSEKLLVTEQIQANAFVRRSKTGKTVNLGLNPRGLVNPSTDPGKLAEIIRHEGAHVADLVVAKSAGSPGALSSEMMDSVLSRVVSIGQAILPSAKSAGLPARYNDPAEIVARLAEVPGRLESIIEAVKKNLSRSLDPLEFYRNFVSGPSTQLPITSGTIPGNPNALSMEQIRQALFNLSDELLKSGLSAEAIEKKLAEKYQELNRLTSIEPNRLAAKPIDSKFLQQQIDDSLVPGQFVGMMQSSKSTVMASDLSIARGTMESLLKQRGASLRATIAAERHFEKAVAQGVNAQDAMNRALVAARRVQGKMSLPQRLAERFLPTFFGPSDPNNPSRKPPIGSRIAARFSGVNVEGARNFLNSGKGFALATVGGLVTQGIVNNIQDPAKKAGVTGIASTLGAATAGFATGGPWVALIAGLTAGASAIASYNEAIEEQARSKTFASFDDALKRATTELTSFGVATKDFATANQARQSALRESQGLISRQSELGTFQNIAKGLVGGLDELKTNTASTLARTGAGAAAGAAIGSFIPGVGTVIGGGIGGLVGFLSSSTNEDRGAKILRGQNFAARIADPEFTSRNQENVQFIQSLIERNARTRGGTGLAGVSQEDFLSLGLAQTNRTQSLQQALKSGQLDIDGFNAAITEIGRQTATEMEAAARKAAQYESVLRSLGEITRQNAQDVREAAAAYQLQSKAINGLLASSEAAASLATSGKAVAGQLRIEDIKGLLGSRANQGRLSETVSSAIAGGNFNAEQQGILTSTLGFNDRFLSFTENLRKLSSDQFSSEDSLKSQLESELRTLVGGSFGDVGVGAAIEAILKKVGADENISAALSDPELFKEIQGPLVSAMEEASSTMLNTLVEDTNKWSQALGNLISITNQNNALVEKSFQVGRERFDLGIQAVFGNAVNPLLFRSNDALIQEQRSRLAARTGGLSGTSVVGGDITGIFQTALSAQTELERVNRLLQGGGGFTSVGGVTSSVGFAGVGVVGAERGAPQFPGVVSEANFTGAFTATDQVASNFTELVTQSQLLADATSKSREQLQFFADGLETTDVKARLDALFGERQRLSGLGEQLFFGGASERRGLRRAQSIEQRILLGGEGALSSLSRRDKQTLQQFQGSLDPRIQETLSRFFSGLAQGAGFQTAAGPNIQQEIANTQQALAEAQNRQAEAINALQQLNQNLIENIRGAIPETVTVQGFQEVEVRLTGAETLKAIQGELTNSVFALLIQELNNRLPPGQA